MTVSPINNREAISQFFAEIAPFESAYKRAAVSFLAEKGEYGLTVVKLLIQLAPLELKTVKTPLETRSIVAGRFEVTGTTSDFVQRLIVRGVVETPFGLLRFNELGTQTATLKAFDERGLATYSRLTSLSIAGGHPDVIRQPVLDWELRAHSIPYSDVADVASEYGFGDVPTAGSLVQVEAMAISMIDAKSPFSGPLASPSIRVAGDIDRSKLRLGIKTIFNGVTVDRTLVEGPRMEWTPAPDVPNVYVGRVEMSVQDGSLLHCYVSYGGAAMHSYFLRDTTVAPNPLRAIIEAFDPQLRKTIEAASTVDIRGHSNATAPNLEHSVSTMLWMLGFSVHSIGSGALTNNAVDLVARSPAGHFLLIECTVGMLKRDKTANLMVRTELVRRTLARTWDSLARVIPVLVTSLKYAEVGHDAKEAERAGIRVFTGDDFARLIEATNFPPNPDSLFAELEAYLLDKQNVVIDGGTF
jgi:hypothetical protein